MGAHLSGAELRAMAEAAEPVNPQALTARAVRGSGRRRLTWSPAGAVVAAACVAGPLVVVTGGPGTTVATPVEELPANTPAQLRLVRECMPAGGPVHSMDSHLRMPGQGDVRDFRVLVEYHDAVGSTALTGSLKGFVLCAPQKYPQFADRTVFHCWSIAKRGSLTVDYYETQTDSHTQRDEGDFQTTRSGWSRAGSCPRWPAWRSTGRTDGVGTPRSPTATSSAECWGGARTAAC
ncbi:hypothetical protein AB0O28_00825 [Microbispora sp. NPDC088329]|uniref:hypothetical protein n=1 Tax=Microbispora sp. NPDC088329 TaxID=3154869 RepID=UPI0034155CEA